MDAGKAVFHARCVFDTMRDAISPGAVKKIERQLSAELLRLLRPAEA